LGKLRLFAESLADVIPPGLINVHTALR